MGPVQIQNTTSGPMSVVAAAWQRIAAHLEKERDRRHQEIKNAPPRERLAQVRA